MTRLLLALESADAAARAEACTALAALGERERPPGTLGSIARAVRDPEASVRRAACRALGEMTDTRAVDPLLSAFADADGEVRGAATAALIAIGEARARARDALGLGGDGAGAAADPRTRLHWVTDLDALDRLAAVLRGRPAAGAEAGGGGDARTAAAYALGALGALGAVKTLVEALADPEARVRAAAAFALGLLGDQEAVPALVSATEDEDARVELEALAALATLGAPEAEEAFLAAARRPDDDLRALAATGTGRLARRSEAAAAEVLRGALGALARDRSPNVRRAVAAAWGVLEARRPLLAFLADPAQSVRETAARALGRDRGGVGAELETLLRDGDGDERRGAAYGLGRLGGPGAAEALRAAIARDPDDRVRAAAAIALADRSMGEAAARPAAREALLGLLTDRVWSLRAAAAEGLRRLGDPTTVAALRRAAGDPHAAVRTAAQTAIRALAGEAG